jgi:hypothetical protein
MYMLSLSFVEQLNGKTDTDIESRHEQITDGDEVDS